MGKTGAFKTGESKTGDTGFSIPGGGVTPTTGWYVEIDNPTTGNTLRPVPLSDPQRNPRVNGLPRVRIPVEKADKWHSTDLKGATMRVWHEGKRQPIDEVALVEQREGRNVLVGVGGTELRTRVTKDVVSEEVYIIARDLVQNNTAYTANFDDPGGSTSETSALSADTTAAWEAITSAITDTDPLAAQNGNIELLQTCWFHEGESTDSGGGADGTNAVSTYSDGSALVLDTQTDVANHPTYSFTPDYDIPSGDLRGNYRLQVRTASQNPAYSIYVNVGGSNEQQVETVSADILAEGISWRTFSDYTGQKIDAGDTVNVRFEVDSSGTDAVDLDCVAPTDHRFNYTFDNSVDTANGHLDGPELYPDSVTLTLDTGAAQAGNIAGARIVSTWDDTSGSQQLEVSNDGGITFPLSTSNSATLDQNFTDAGQLPKARITLSRYGTRDGTSPQTGFNGQVVQDFELFADVEDSPVLSGWDADDRLLDVLVELADYSNSVFEVRIDSNGDFSIEWTTPGGRTSDIQGAVANYQVSEDSESKVEKAVVFGASTPVEGETFTSDHGTAVSLANSPIVRNSERVYDGSGTTFTRFEDYIPRYNAGTIETLSSGSISDSTTTNVDYRYKVQGSHTASGVSSPRTRVFRDGFAGLATVRACQQAAKVIVDRAKDPLVEATMTIDTQPLGWNVIDAINPDALPTTADLQIQQVQDTPSQVVVMLANRKEIGQIVGDVQAKLTGGSLKGSVSSVSRQV